MINGLHAMFYCSHAEELRAFLRDKLGFDCYDSGGGWLMFDGIQADMGVHPTDYKGHPPSGTADISFTCDDIEATVAELKGKGVEFTEEIKNAGFGMTAFMKVPGGFSVMLYQPLYGRG